MRVVSNSSMSPPSSPSTLQQSMMISPEVALDLRIRWLEALVKGVNIREEQPIDVKQRVNGVGKAKDTDLARRIEEIQSKLDGIVEGNDSLKLFMQYCESR